MVKVRDEFTPDMKRHALYNRLNDEVYRDFTKYTDDILKKTYEIFDV